MKKALLIFASPLLALGVVIFVAAAIVKNHVDAQDAGKDAS